MKKLNIRFIQLFLLIRYSFFRVFKFLYQNKYKHIWLVSERGDEARDNGFSFFEYMIKEHPEIDCRYVISKDSNDINKFHDKSKLVYYRSNLHFKIFISAKYLISTHIMGFAPDFRSFGKLDKRIKFFCVSGKKIFLQHGITKDYIEYLTSKSVNLDLFICGAKPEYDYIRDNFGFNDGVVKYTGFSRYDKLVSKKSNYILFMPTWRKSLFYLDNEAFKNSYYCKMINEVLSSKELNESLKENKYKLIFYPHHEIQNRIDCFKGNDSVIIASEKDYDISNLLVECNMLITDFSSVYFDVAYQHKPVIYYQFDEKEYRKEHYSEGYFNYHKNGFGKVVDNGKEVVDLTIKYIENKFKVEDKYSKKTSEFFKLRDKNNSKRIYEEIIKL